jgi:predicted RNA-binding protein associated with RNAse of E/G family
MGGTILEVKRHLDGREETFECEGLVVTRDVAVVRFVNPKPIGTLPAGSATLGFFWRRRPYNLYRFLAPDGDLLGHRMDVVADVRIEPERLEYLDLVVDVRVSPTGELEIEDEDEAKEVAERGLLRPEHLAAIERALRTIVRDHRRILRDALQTLRDAQVV